ncbi:TIGR00730 family Rossman fold protein [Periweissella cryptocerci]|uniref:Cytokinin riboside 5'-monophosphate phosphoribohydrolase n=1 Tax=Periweissella cryptocerci TaxID=2506420 RepID=A0A4P6YT49_9LACO|nr:TIGR00730 family Rossman fold protein [Periweissella cryptocerci]QBO35813.1 TIGR00730 family Rossman fold protein [Periweissella cryptocerci]
MSIKSVAVFCGSHKGKNPHFSEQAALLGHYLAAHELELVYGGSEDGLMGVVALATMKAGGRVYGVHPANLTESRMNPADITELITVPDMDTRKRKMIERADAFIVLPGGFGTLEELGQVISWSKIDLQEKPTAFFNIDNFYDTLWAWLNETIEAGFVPKSDLDLVYNGSSIEDIFGYFDAFKYPEQYKK